jgi:hypothetical protein
LRISQIENLQTTMMMPSAIAGPANPVTPSGFLAAVLSFSQLTIACQLGANVRRKGEPAAGTACHYLVVVVVRSALAPRRSGTKSCASGSGGSG